MDPYQYAYVKGRDLNQALLDLTLDIKGAFKNKEHTGCIMVDFEGAYDAVWREGIIYKLCKFGLSGRILSYIYSFLNGRFTRSLVNSVTTPWIPTNIGIPQGSVIGPVLYIIFTQDISEYISVPHVKYADDITFWTSGVNPSDTEDILSHNLSKLLAWSFKWRQMINIEKTEAMCFSIHGDIKLNIMANNNKLKQVGEKRLLGVTFDPELNFKAHIEVTIAKVKGMIAKLGALTQGLKGANPDFMISIYKSCLRPHLEFGYTIWCTNKDIKELLNVQNLALRRCTGTMYGTPSNSLEVIARVVPLDIRLENSLLCTFLRISRNNKLPLKNKIITLLNDSHFMDYRVLTSLHMFRTASKQVDLNNVEPVIHMSMEHLTTSNPHAVNIEDFKNFGSSSNRTDSQKEAALLKTLDYLASTRNDIIAFTDGSALGNPGPCGAGTAIYWNGLSDQPSHHLHPVSQKSSSYHGELYAILLTLEATVNKYPPIYNRKLHIITDCQSAVLATTN